MKRIVWNFLPGSAVILVLWMYGAAPLRADEVPVSTTAISSSALDESFHSLIISGFGAGNYNYNWNTGDNSFTSSALAISLFKPITSRISVFAQLTTALESEPRFLGGEAGEEEPEGEEASAEIDNMQLRWATSSRGPDITFGKFDSPMGIERDDAPLNYQATESFNFQFGKPVKFTGVQVHQAFSEKLEAWFVFANGWDSDPDNNKGKTVAVSGMWAPTSKIHIGLGEIYGPEKDDISGDRRSDTIATVLIQPLSGFVIGMDGNFGSEPFGVVEGEDGGEQDEETPQQDGTGKWRGVVVFGHYRVPAGWGATARYEVFSDRDGARTGVAQKLQSFTISPQFLLKQGFYGIFRNMERTTLSLPEVSIRADIRWDWSDEPVFQTDTEEGKKTNSSITIQTVFLF